MRENRISPVINISKILNLQRCNFFYYTTFLVNNLSFFFFYHSWVAQDQGNQKNVISVQSNIN